jgi:hypothetical protein
MRNRDFPIAAWNVPALCAGRSVSFSVSSKTKAKTTTIKIV